MNAACLGLTAALAATGALHAQSPAPPADRKGGVVEIRSPFFVYRLDFKNGLRAESWENRLTGTKLSLAGGPEIEADAGLPSGPVKTVRWLPAETRVKSKTDGEIVFELRSEAPELVATVKYTWDSKQPVLRKFTQIRNGGGEEINRLLNVRLGDYAPATGTALAGGAERGFPAYIGDEFFATLAHPAGFSKVENGHVVLRQHPGVKLAPGESFACMEAVLGVSAKGKARDSFTEHVRSRMRRVRRNHDKPFALLESFGGQPSGEFWTTEQYLLDHLAKVDQGIREGGPRFDFYCTEFWHDTAGDLTTFHRKNFPNGFAKVRDEILRLGMRPGLWIDSGGLPDWTIKDNPAIRGCFTKGDRLGEICRASEPINSIYKKGFIQQVRENKVGLLKFDNLGPACGPPSCDNPAHGHLPGPIYSVEAIHNAAIDFLTELDAACPDVFMMLYWGYRSPWWLLHADTYFECGAHMEAASPSGDPAPFARDSVTRRLDEGQTQITDTPWLGKDSLGIWLSDWPWNSCIGKARWQEGFIMDLCRGSLLAQVWTDTNWLTPDERRQLAEFIALFKAHPDCFGHSRLILGNPSKGEPYGYACGDGQRTFLAIHNAALKDNLVTLPLGPACGLPADKQWDIYRWHPAPSRLTNSHRLSNRPLQIALRPYQVVLLEIVPAGGLPSLKRAFDKAPMPLAFPEPSRQLDLNSMPLPAQPDDSTKWQVLTPVSAVAGKAKLTPNKDGSILASGEIADGDTYTLVAQTGRPEITAVMLEALTDDSLPAHGPGRAENGNFALTGFNLFAAPRDQPNKTTEIKLRTARAGFSQTTHGGWPVAAAIDTDPNSGWSVHPMLGMAHAAVFELEKPLGSGESMALTFKLTQGQRRHALGRFRLSASGEASPILPPAYTNAGILVRAQLPASRTGGILLLTSAKETAIPNASLAGRALQLDPVWSDNAMWPCPWRAWRTEIEPDNDPRELRILIQSQQTPIPRLEAYLLPRSP